MSDFTDLRWQRFDYRVWAYTEQGGVLIATFNESHVLRDRMKLNNARRAVACVNFCHGRTTEQIEAAMQHGLTIVEATQSKQALAAMGVT